MATEHSNGILERAVSVGSLAAEIAPDLSIRRVGLGRLEREEFTSIRDALPALVTRLKEMDSTPCQEPLKQTITAFVDHVSRIDREAALSLNTLESEARGSALWGTFQNIADLNAPYYGEMDKKADALDKSLHRTYLHGLQRKLLSDAHTLVTSGMRESFGTQLDASLHSVHVWFSELASVLRGSAITAAEAAVFSQARAHNQYLDHSIGSYVERDMSRKMLNDTLNTHIRAIEASEMAVSELALFTTMALASDGDRIESFCKRLMLLDSNEGLRFLAEQLQVADTEPLIAGLRRQIAAATNTLTIPETGMVTLLPASMSAEVRSSLAEQTVALISASLKKGGAFLEKYNTADAFFQAYSLPGTVLNGEFKHGRLLSVAPVHLGDYPEGFEKLENLYPGSLDAGFLRLVAIAHELQGTDAYDRLNTRVLLSTAGKVDFLFGRLRVGEDFNKRGVRHIKAGHQPNGAVEHSDDKMFQHLIMPVSAPLRSHYELMRPKGYLPPLHRDVGKAIEQRSCEMASDYSPEPFAKMYLLLGDPGTQSKFAYVPEEYIAANYSSLPEGLHPGHLLYRYHRTIRESTL